MKPGERLEALEGLRGYAAFLVFLVHAFGYLGGELYGFGDDPWATAQGPAPAAVAWLHRSHYGVDLFFVLSGFLMADLAFGRWPGTRRFLVRRWLRIYPAYALSALASGLFAYTWLDHRFDGAVLLGNALLLQGFFVLGLVAANPVTWSLTYEMVFYLAVPLIARRAAGRPGLARGWLATLTAAYAALLALAWAIPDARGVYFAYFALFIPGVALGALHPGERARLAAAAPLALAAVAWIAFTLPFKVGALQNTMLAYYPLSSIACGLVVLKATDARGALARALATPPLRAFGRYSYSFFLMHFIVLQVWGALLHGVAQRLGSAGYGAAFLAGGFALSWAAARLLYAVTERFYFRAASPQPLAS